MSGESSKPILPGAPHTTQNPGPIATGSGGDGIDGGMGGRGGDVHIHYDSHDDSLLMALPRALSAAHDSGREDAPTSCLEGTRVAILEQILSWSESANGERPPVYWLSGLAGIGKSTIAKTVAEHAEKKAMLGATFFFSRSDNPLRDPGLVVPTLAFQLAFSDSAFKEVLVEAIRQNPTAGRKELLPQLQALILNPLLNINPGRRPVLIILDALDECRDKGAANILRLVFTHLIRIPFLRILITSRPEPHLSSVFHKAPMLAKTVLHDIEASVIQQDIRLYISTELAKIPEKLNLAIPANWVAEDEKNSLVEKSGKLFIYAATAIRFIGDDRVQDPRTHLSLILNAGSVQQVGATPYSQLDDLYTGVLKNSLPGSNPSEIPKRFQIVVGSIVLLREPLSLDSLARFVERERDFIETTLRHFHSVIVPPSDVHDAPRIYHPSFLEFITEPSRCSIPAFAIVSKGEQEVRHAIRCFQLMGKHLKRDVAGISDPSLLNEEIDGFAEKVREALLPEVQYACRYWASHLLRVEFGERKLMEALEGFTMRLILWWFEAMSLLGSVSNAVKSIEEAHRWAESSKCRRRVVKILSDSRRFILAHGEVIRESALHVYHSALPFIPHNTELYKVYCGDGKDSIAVLQGLESEWPQHLSTLRGHSDLVQVVAFSPDGLRLASGSHDHTVCLWDGISGALITKLEGHSDSVWTIAFSPDGLHLASGSKDHTVCLWDGISGASITTLEGHSDWIKTIAFSPDGLHLASGSKDHTVRLWDGISGAPIATWGHSRSVLTLAFSPDGSRLASGSDDSTVHLLDGISGKSIATLGGHSSWVRTLAFSPDGSRLASGSRDCTVCLWDGISHILIAKLEGHYRAVLMVAFSPNGLCLASGSEDHTVCLWDAISGTSIAKLEGHSDWIMTVAFSPDGLRLASGSWDHTVHLWDAISGAPIATLKGHSDPVQTIAFSPDGLRLASGSDDCTVRLWDGISGARIATLKGHSNLVWTIAFSPDGLHLASGSHDHTVCLWDGISGARIAKLAHHSGIVWMVTFSPDGSRLASCSSDHTVCLWDGTSGAPIAELKGHSKSVGTIAFSPDGLRLASGSRDSSVCLWDAISGTSIEKLNGHSDGVGVVAFSPDGSCLASGSDDCSICLWDGRSGMAIVTLKRHSHAVWAVTFSPDGSHLASGTSNGTVCLWDGISSTLIAKLKGHSRLVGSIAFSPDGLRLASGSHDSSVHLWDGVSGRSIAKLNGHSDSVLMVAFSPDGLCLASGSHDHTVRLWDGMSGTSIAKLEGHSNLVWTIAFSPDGSRLASCSSDHTVCLWDGISSVSITKLKGHSSSVLMVAFSPDGLRVASASSDHTVCLWDGISGAPIAKLKGHSHPVSKVAFSPDGSRLASSVGGRTVRLWDAISGASIATVKGHFGSIQESLFSSHGHTSISQPPHHFPSSSHPATTGPSAGLSPIWSLHNRWVEAKRQEDGQTRRVCYIPPHYALKTLLAASSQQTHTRIVIGCEDGRVLMLAVPRDPFNWDLSDQRSLLAHHRNLKLKGFRKFLQWLN